MLRRALFIALLFASLAARADDQVRSVQEELRRRNIYFGDVDGRSSPELQEALKHYQQNKGFRATGEQNPETLRALDLRPRVAGEPAPKELEWPAEPVLKSDTKIQESAEASEISRQTGVAYEAIASGPGGRIHKSERSRSASHGESNGPRRPVPRGRGQPGEMGDRELRAFIAGYLAALSSRNPAAELRFYADSVNYFSNGRLDRRIIERAIAAYRLRWPSCKYSLAGPVSAALLPQRGLIEIRFQARFSLSGAGKRAKGETVNRVLISAATVDPRIVSIEESRVRP